MNYQGALAGLMIFGCIAVYAETPVETSTIDKAKSGAEKIISKGAENTLDNKNDDNKKSDKKEDKKTASKEELSPETKAMKKKKLKLTLENTLRAERLKNDNSDLLAELQKIKWEKALISEQLAIKELKRKRDKRDETIAYENELLKMKRAAALAKEKTLKLSSEYDFQRIEWDAKTSQLNAEVATLKAQEKREAYVDSKPVYLDNPLKDDNTLVISDRRIALNGPILEKTADYIATRINYYNNKNSTKPIFIVIDSSPGGSIMAGYRILKAMDGSKSPVYVVLKSYAASMAAAMLTLSEKSYAYPNAVILHHQVSSFVFFANFNLTQQKEQYTEMKKWWERLAVPIAKKMGITTDEFIKKMYEKSSDGDWSEFATDAKDLKWVDNIVDRIEETSLLVDPDYTEKNKRLRRTHATQALDKQGRPVAYLPRLSPKDMYFLYNPDNYYQLR